MNRICIFARVSTNVQDYERQVNELTSLAQRNAWSVEAVFCEKVSGAKKNTERKELSRMVEYVQAHNINKVAVTELSRLGRDTLQVLEVIEQFNKLGISLYRPSVNVSRAVTRTSEPMAERSDVRRATRSQTRQCVSSMLRKYGCCERVSVSVTSARLLVRASIQYANVRVLFNFINKNLEF